MVYVLKVATSGFHLNFYERNAITSAVFATWHNGMAPPSDSETFFWSSLIAGRNMWQKSPKCQGPCAM